jgi:hypothetical protein
MQSFLPSNRKQWAAVSILFALICTLTLPIYVPPMFDWHLVQGRSMWPTIKWLNTFPHLSGWVHTVTLETAPNVSDIVVFRLPNSRFATQVKRVAKKRYNFGLAEWELWLSADNAGMTGEGSDFSDLYKWVPTRNIIGVVDQMWPRSMPIDCSAEDQELAYWAQFSFPPKTYVVNGGLVAAVSGGKFLVYDKSKCLLFTGTAFNFASGALYPIACRNGRFAYKPDNVSHIWAVFDPNATGQSRHYVFNALATLPLHQDGDQLSGNVVLRPGASIVFTHDRKLGVDDQHESHYVPTVSIDSGKPIRCSMGTNFLVHRKLSNVGQGACVVSF